MNAFPTIYKTVNRTTEYSNQFFFISEGKTNITKTVQFTYALDFQERQVFNLAFGDYDPNTDSIIDDLISNNGDPYKVFNTVLHAIQQFFLARKDATIMVFGSDSTLEFQHNCYFSCKKECLSTECKNAHRRINIYRRYVNKNLDNLTKDYEFFGGSFNDENQLFIEPYIRDKNYLSILVRKKS